MKTKLFSRGFTLIELLVVIAIIGILASVVLASLSSAREKSRNAAKEAEMKEVVKALDLYLLANGHYPNSNSWDCFGEGADDLCFANVSPYTSSDIHADLTNANGLPAYINLNNISDPTDGQNIGGQMYGEYRAPGDAADEPSGYIIIYALEGSNQQCAAGYNRQASSADGNTGCTICGGTYVNGTWCTDRF